ncbi:MAG: hypothetical protein JWM88_3255 [Verrucomicrobia bacterium]|nr:hypothetical protein [Verrucomicrobiota bacterium]
MPARPSRSIATLRTAFFSGLLLLAPLVVTVWAFTKIIDLVGGTFRPLFFFYMPEWLLSSPRLAIVWDILATIIVVLLVTLLGFLSRYVFGKYFLEVGERVIQGIPGVSAVYNTVKQIVDTFGTQNRNLFSKVVLVQYPRREVWTLGFLTSKAQAEAQTRTGQEVWTVFVPTSPNPTSGFLLMLPRAEVTELEMTVGDGMKMVISGGAVVPPWNKPDPARKIAATET